MPTSTLTANARGVALVTGAGRRLGAAIAKGLAEDGFAVAVHYQQSEKEALAVVDAIVAAGGRAKAIRGDLAHPDIAPRLFDAAEELGPVTCLVNNASRFEHDTATSFDVSQWQSHLDTNLRAPVLLSQALATRLKSDATGCIVNILDQKVYNLNPDHFTYTISKLGLEGATRLLALSLAPRVRVCGVAPGITLPAAGQSDQSFARAHREAPLGHSSETEDIVDAVRYLVGAKAVTGQVLVVDGGQHMVARNRDVQFEVGS